MQTKTLTHRLVTSWQVWGILLALTFGGIGFAATNFLFSLPSNAKCDRFLLLFSSATSRIYCAQLQAEQQTVTGLLKAIAIVEKLASDHPLRGEIDRYVREWSQEILSIGEQKFQEGNLDEAIEIAKQIPTNVPDHSDVTRKIEYWREIWQKAEAIDIDLEKELRLGQWNKAFLVATEFLNLPNQYWQTTKYQETVNKINLAREESKELDAAYVALNRGGASNLLEAIKIANKVAPSSYSYDQAQQIIEDANEQIVEYALDLFENQRWSELAELASQIPHNLEDLTEQAEDWSLLASAGQNATLGTVSGLDLAIAQASNIDLTNPIYQETQNLIKNWEIEKEDLAYLAEARNLAFPGDINDLSQAIAKAELISANNPLYGEARREIKKWQRKIETIEDQPMLSRAQQLAQGNNIQSWQQAINQASQIRANRALYSEAQSLISKWKRNIQNQEDQPFLSRAIALANNGNYRDAINTASQIRVNRVLYPEAQTKIRLWRRQIQAQQDLQQAFTLAQNNTPESLLKAINIARGIPSSTDVKEQSRQGIERWAEQMLAIARKNAQVGTKMSIQEAINIADMIPYGTSAYQSARQEISQWQQQLKPPLVIPPLTPIQETNYFSNDVY
jgi:hypothetical protein